METIRVRLRFLAYPNEVGIILPLHLCQKLQLRPRQKIIVSLGKREVTATVYQNRKYPESNIVKVTSALKQRLGIPHAGLIHLKREDDTLRIGPAIGIVTTGVTNNLEKPIGLRTGFFQKLLKAQEGKGVFYFIFAPQDVDWDHHLVRGWFLRPTKQGRYAWRKLTTAMPDVVYDRIPSRAAEKQDIVQAFKLRLAHEENLPMFNRGFFDKWGVYKLLSPLPEVNEHIPETHLSPSLETLRSMLRKYRMIYMKPINGSLGYGIVKVRYLPRRGYELTYHNGSGHVRRMFKKLLPLYQHVFRNRRKRSYLIQQGIQLCTYQGRPFDFRVHLHKNQQNDWVVSCMAAKVAGAGSVTTHVRTGGMVMPGEEILEYLFGAQWQLVEERIRNAAVRLSSAIEEAQGIPLGELGLDMGIDTHGHVWMFEANSKPGRSIFKHSRLRQADEMSLGLIVDYSCYLANF
ncbi:YheC/YheD family protein [Brevibacillus humidisoli]|uniref:YheC/YheD family endospore coat-associated protein n=1 Tax=Brevibacillus humidisoli TaxID=2895522 RepID=UPI001E33AE63|nr:YheC/YheD family protein [Brevibacillus humidisoli]UFJ41508.1 YheC/YheD family protein [Brevibacillus humidisoli]